MYPFSNYRFDHKRIFLKEVTSKISLYDQIMLGIGYTESGPCIENACIINPVLTEHDKGKTITLDIKGKHTYSSDEGVFYKFEIELTENDSLVNLKLYTKLPTVPAEKWARFLKFNNLGLLIEENVIPSIAPRYNPESPSPDYNDHKNLETLHWGMVNSKYEYFSDILITKTNSILTSDAAETVVGGSDDVYEVVTGVEQYIKPNRLIPGRHQSVEHGRRNPVISNTIKLLDKLPFIVDRNFQASYKEILEVKSLTTDKQILAYDNEGKLVRTFVLSKDSL